MTSYFSFIFLAAFLPVVVVLYAVAPRRTRWVVLLMAHDYIALREDVCQWFGRFGKPVRYTFYFALIFVVLYSRQLGEYSFVYFQF